MGKEPLTREEYDEAVDAYIDEFKKNSIDKFTFVSRLKNIGMDKDEAEYLARTS